ncbi:DinB family protein [Streptomyces sp. NBC_00859]|uniref:DinB family protein n=1 Tax=Streptomyces sp. NBC_00859 TaxID=2903682 RepID=UPI00386CB402|nr:DinB family protein [Streptomyces sp. NBC_00859]
MSESTPVPAPAPEASADLAEAAALRSVLERNRRTFAWKTSGLDAKALGATTAASSMTLGGLVKHVALVEADWLAVKLAGHEYGAPWDAVDFDADPDWEWRTGALDSPDDVYAVWRDAVERSRELVAQVVKERGLDGPAAFTWPDGRTPTVRDMLLDMIEEYARHTGHADLLREAVDGRVGEGAPKDFTF